MPLHDGQTQKPRGRQPSFSSSLLDAIYRSTDDRAAANEHPETMDFHLQRRTNSSGGPQFEREIERFRRAVMIEKWIENYRTSTNVVTASRRHEHSNSSGSSNMLSPTETESSASKSTPKNYSRKPEITHPPAETRQASETGPMRDGKLTIAKLRACKIDGELKKAKEPISPGRRISNFFNSIFSTRNSRKNPGREERISSVVNSRSLNGTRTGSFASRSCLSKNQFSSRGNYSNNSNIIDNKKSQSTRSVRFCPVNVMLDENGPPSRPNKGLYSEEGSTSPSEPVISSLYIKKNINILRLHETKTTKKHDFTDNNYCYYHHYQQQQQGASEFDETMSCASSDLFELENIGRAGLVTIGACDEQLPVGGVSSGADCSGVSLKFV